MGDRNLTVSKHPSIPFPYIYPHLQCANLIINWVWSVAMLLLITLLSGFLITTPREVAAGGFLTWSKSLEITEYSVVKQGIISGNYIESDIFTVGHNQWVIEFYLQDENSSYFDYVSVMLKLTNPRNVVREIFTHRLRDWNTSAWSTDTPFTSNVQFLAPSSNRVGYYKFIKRSDLEASNYLRNDTLVMKTTLWLLRDSSTVHLLPLSNIADVSTGDNNNQRGCWCVFWQ